MRTVVLINAHSRQSRKSVPAVKEYFKSEDCPFYVLDLIIVRRLQRFDKYIQRLRKYEEAECVIVGGGDGTILAVLNAMRDNNELVYGFLPLGTGNAFVRNLDIPVELDDALQVLAAQKVSMVSLGQINGALFSSIVSIGVSARVADQVSDTTKRIFGFFAYVLSGAKALLGHRPFLCTFEYDGKSTTFKTHQLVISNGRYHGKAYFSEKATVYKNQLVAISFGTDGSKKSYVGNMLRMMVKRHESSDSTLVIPFKKAKISTTPIRKVEADGEVLYKTPASIEVVPNALKVIAPEQSVA